MPVESEIKVAFCLGGVALILGVWAYLEINKLKKEISDIKKKEEKASRRDQ